MILSADAVSLSLNGQMLPGIFDNLSVGSKLIVDAKNVEGGSGKQYQINGFDDASISFSLRLIDDTSDGVLIKKEEALAKIMGLFKKFDNAGKPLIYTLDFPLARASNLQGCLFLSLDSSQSGGKQEIKVSLKFSEYRPAVAKVQEQAESTRTKTKVSDPPTSPAISKDEEIAILQERTK